MKKILWIVGSVVLLALGLLAYVRFHPRTVPAGQMPLVSLDAGNLDQLRGAFNAAGDRVRVLALLSPT